MPRIDEKIETKRPFKKKPYRPWNLLEEDIELAVTKPNNTCSESVTNGEPTGNQLVTIEESKSNHLDINEGSNRTNKESISNPPSKQISNQINHFPITYQSQIDAKDIVRRLVGLQKKILFFIVDDCVFRNQLYTGPIPTDALKQVTSADTDTLKTAVQRLINKKIINREKGKKGIGGFAIFSISEQIRSAVLEEQREVGNQIALVTNWESKKEPNSTISRSSYINTTTNESQKLKDDSPWSNLDIQPLASIGFTQSHLRQIILDDKLSAEIVQDSINFFAFDLEQNNKEKNLKTGPLNYFMGILRSGKPYAPPANYESPQDKEMRIYLERKKEIEQRRKTMKEELFQFSFNDWEAALSDQDKEAIFPSNIRNSKFAAEKKAFLRTHFKDIIWPNIEKNKPE